MDYSRYYGHSEDALSFLERWCLIGEKKVCLLVGQRGAGSTFALRMLSRRMLDQRDKLTGEAARKYPVAIYVNCEQLPRGQSNPILSSIVAQGSGSFSGSDYETMKKNVQELISKGNIILLIDHADRYLSSGEVARFLSDVDGGKTVLALARPLVEFKKVTGLLELPSDQYLEIGIMPKSPATKVAQLIKRSDVPPAEAEQIVNFCEINGLRALTNNSRLLTIIGSKYLSLLQDLTVEAITGLLAKEVFLQVGKEWSDIFGMPLLGLQAQMLYHVKEGGSFSLFEIDTVVKHICKEMGINPSLADLAAFSKLILLHPFIALATPDRFGLIRGIDLVEWEYFEDTLDK